MYVYESREHDALRGLLKGVQRDYREDKRRGSDYIEEVISMLVAVFCVWIAVLDLSGSRV